MNIPRKLFTPADALTHGCYQVVTFEARGLPSVYQFKTSREAAEFVVLNNNGDYTPVIQYIEPLDVPIPEMDMPPRPQDLEPMPTPQTSCNSSDSVEDSQHEETGSDKSAG